MAVRECEISLCVVGVVIVVSVAELNNSRVSLASPRKWISTHTQTARRNNDRHAANIFGGAFNSSIYFGGRLGLISFRGGPTSVSAIASSRISTPPWLIADPSLKTPQTLNVTVMGQPRC
jgi:hypothetical protein